MNAIIKTAAKIAAYRKGRTVFTILCVILSVSMIAITLCVSDAVLSVSELEEEETNRTAARSICTSFTAAAAVMTVFAICTVFSVSAEDRIREMGFLSSIGMSKAQRAAMILLEAAAVGAVGAILGTALGIFISAAFIGSIAELLRPFGILIGRFSVSRGAVCASALLGLGAVLISSFWPIYRMRRLSVLETIKARSQINISLKETVMSRLAGRLFGKIGVLAGQNYDNNKVKYRAISLALSGGTIFFITVHTFFLYPFWYEIDMGHGVANVEEIWFPLAYVSALFMAYFVFVFLFCSIGSVYQNMERRRGEIAMYKSMGMLNSELYKMMCIECLFLTWYSILFGLAGSLLGSYAVCGFYRLTGPGDLRFHYPSLEFLLFVCLDVFAGIAFSVYFCRRASRVNIIETIKNR